MSADDTSGAPSSDPTDAPECNCGCHNKGPHAYHFEDCPMRDHPESVKLRLAVVEEDHDHVRKTLKFWLDRMNFWEGKFRIVKHENNTLRRKLYVRPQLAEETPETDARVFNAPIFDSTMRSIPFDAVSADFARSLERRLRAALAERDEARSKMARYRADFEMANVKADQFYKERDRALSELSEARKDTERLDWLTNEAGAFQDDSFTTVQFSGDDATRTWHMKIGVVQSYGSSLRAAIDRARETPPFDQPPENA